MGVLIVLHIHHVSNSVQSQPSKCSFATIGWPGNSIIRTRTVGERNRGSEEISQRLQHKREKKERQLPSRKQASLVG
jgi:hypothetical protein